MTKRHDDEPSASAQKLLAALIDIEDRAIAAAREGGCECSDKVPDTDRSYPFARFKRDTSIGRPFDQIEWELVHELGCPMDGQTGVG